MEEFFKDMSVPTAIGQSVIFVLLVVVIRVQKHINSEHRLAMAAVQTGLVQANANNDELIERIERLKRDLGVESQSLLACKEAQGKYEETIYGQALRIAEQEEKIARMEERLSQKSRIIDNLQRQVGILEQHLAFSQGATEGAKTAAVEIAERITPQPHTEPMDVVVVNKTPIRTTPVEENEP